MDDIRTIVEGLARRSPQRADAGHRPPAPFGERQLRILAALEAGPHSVEALAYHLAGNRGPERARVLAAIGRLEDRGAVRVIGRQRQRGPDLAGVLVELVGETR